MLFYSLYIYQGHFKKPRGGAYVSSLDNLNGTESINKIDLNKVGSLTLKNKKIDTDGNDQEKIKDYTGVEKRINDELLKISPQLRLRKKEEFSTYIDRLPRFKIANDTMDDAKSTTHTWDQIKEISKNEIQSFDKAPVYELVWTTDLGTKSMVNMLHTTTVLETDLKLPITSEKISSILYKTNDTIKSGRVKLEQRKLLDTKSLNVKNIDLDSMFEKKYISELEVSKLTNRPGEEDQKPKEVDAVDKLYLDMINKL